MAEGTLGDLQAELRDAIASLKNDARALEAAMRDRVVAAPADRNAQLALIEALRMQGREDEALAELDKMLALQPDDVVVLLSQGHLLRSMGRRDEAIAAYRAVLPLRPGNAEVYSSLANLKTGALDSADITAIRAHLARADVADSDRARLHFALASALESAGLYDEAFAHYADGNALSRRLVRYDANKPAAFVRDSKRLFTAAFFEARRGAGVQSADPIFIVGMPRSGSTLIEQILSSHSAVEGLGELNLIPDFAEALGKSEDYFAALARVPAQGFAALGREYAARTRPYRRHATAHFIDKLPSNFLHVGLIHLMLPSAKIVDVRRHPMACCVSSFRQHFARGQGFASDLADCGRYYRDYVDLMEHWNVVLPGKVHRLIYENLVADPYREIRALLAYCGLGFEEACLRFFETRRAILTPSSEQVRRPIFTHALEQWRHYEPWLGPLKAELGPVLDAYPGVPES